MVCFKANFFSRIIKCYLTITGRWILLFKEVIMADDSPHITMQSIITFECSLVFLLCHCAVTAQPKANLRDIENHSKSVRIWTRL